MWIAGVDGCPTGWLCISLELETRDLRTVVYDDIRQLLDATGSYSIVAIDIPIGLPDSGPRECDLIARRLLGSGRASSVFPAPVRATLGAPTWEEACRRSELACGKRMSRQTFAILDRIAEVDEQMCADPELQDRVREIHPEVCFYFLNGEAPMQASKKTREGADDRLELINREFAGGFDLVRGKVRSRRAADDDIIDAFAALWTAERMVLGRALSIPVDPPRDACGLKMEMVA